MAVAVPLSGVVERTDAKSSGATWAALSAGVALIASIPLVIMLAIPVSDLFFYRGSAHDGDWSFVLAMVAILVAPATYAMFFATAGEFLKTRVTETAHRVTMRVAAAGMVPYVVLATIGSKWDGGPQMSLLTTAALTIPIAIAATIWVSAQSHD